MRCEDIQLELALRADGGSADAGFLREHLAACPVCRQKAADLQEIRLDLRKLSRPQIPAPLVSSIRNAVRAEAQPSLPIYGLLNPGAHVRSFRLLIISYTAGAFASVVLGLSFLSIILSSGSDGGGLSSLARNNSPVPLTDSPALNVSRISVSPKDYANTRSDIAAVSPSVNPQGSLIDLTASLLNGDLKDDEVVVVADVYQNGSAQIAQVVEPSRNENAVGELARALDYGSVNTAFVPATLDQRSETVRVVLKIQSVNVSTKIKPRKMRS